ncbi:hypothetical protein, partial [Staphylococcus aureus]|uniref:hypothetical protein n=1 Tax=Staphylococcus aureus TaxID=1280 RepID=UPI00301B78D2
VTKSLVTTFGLDFLLFEDKKGGDVATVHNVRQHQKGDAEIYVSKSVQAEYANKGDYKPVKHHADGSIVTDRKNKPKREDRYHSHQNYKAKGKSV